MPLRRLIVCLALTALPCLAAGPLRLGTVDVPPYGLHAAGDEADGMFFQLANRIAQGAGLPFQHALYPTGRLYALLAHRELDMAISSRQLDRDLGLINLGKLWQLEGVILYRAALPLTPQRIDDFRPYSIGRLPGTCPTLVTSHMQLYDLANYTQGLRMLAAGRLDGLCGDRNALGYLVRRHASELTVTTRTFTFLTSDIWVFANPTLPADTRAKLSASLYDLVSSGEAQRLIERYIPASPPERKPTPP